MQIFFLQHLTETQYRPIFAVQNNKNSTLMDNLIARIVANDSLNEIEAKAKLNLIYIKMQHSDIKTFVDEFTEWLMTEKQMNYKAILQTSDSELHDIYLKEYKR